MTDDHSRPRRGCCVFSGRDAACAHLPCLSCHSRAGQVVGQVPGRALRPFLPAARSCWPDVARLSFSKTGLPWGKSSLSKAAGEAHGRVPCGRGWLRPSRAKRGPTGCPVPQSIAAVTFCDRRPRCFLIVPDSCHSESTFGEALFHFVLHVNTTF